MNSKMVFPALIVLVALLSIHGVPFAQTNVTEQSKINFTSFTVNPSQKRIKIDWATDNKVATNYFQIERSSDGVNFKTIALVFGPDPKQPKGDCYECFDRPDKSTKKYFYRLKHVSIEGEVEMSETKMLAVNK